jgi:hypothetical protein
VTWEPINLAAPDYATPAEPPYCCGLLYRGKRHAISGPPEAAKTLLTLILGLEHMRGDHGAFALIDFETGPNSIRLLLEDLGATLDEIGAVLYFEPEGPPTDDDLGLLTDAGVTLAAIDAAAGATTRAASTTTSARTSKRSIAPGRKGCGNSGSRH